jgi:hypothetical protein
VVVRDPQYLTLLHVHVYTSLRPEIIIIVFQQVSNVVWVEWGWKNPLVFIFILVKWWDISMRHNNYNLPLRRTLIQLRMALLFFQLINSDGINEMRSIAGNSFNRECDRREGREEKKVINLSIICIWWRLIVFFICR